MTITKTESISKDIDITTTISLKYRVAPGVPSSIGNHIRTVVASIEDIDEKVKWLTPVLKQVNGVTYSDKNTFKRELFECNWIIRNIFPRIIPRNGKELQKIREYFKRYPPIKTPNDVLILEMFISDLYKELHGRDPRLYIFKPVEKLTSVVKWSDKDFEWRFSVFKVKSILGFMNMNTDARSILRLGIMKPKQNTRRLWAKFIEDLAAIG